MFGALVRHVKGRAVLAILPFAAHALLACGGVEVPVHDGYREGQERGWKKPKVLDFDEDFEIEDDGELSYPKRRRARWMAVNLPDDGELQITVETTPTGLAAEAAELEEENDPFNIAFEVLDERFKILERADREADDASDRKRSRTVSKLLKGRYLLHLYLEKRLDEAEYTLRIKYNRVAIDPETDFPAQVAFIEPLPVVPAFDDSPEGGGRRCKGSKCGKRPKPDKDPVANNNKPPGDVPAGQITARIIGVRQASSGTTITISVGSNDGVNQGWKGQVITTKGQAIPGGSFKISKVTARTSTATVSASPDAVTGAKRVSISPP